MTGIKETILKESATLKKQVISLRRHFHKYPELSYKEFETSAFIKEWLRENSIEFRDNIAGTGIIASVSGKGEGNKVIAVRAEMDCLPVTERAINDFSSVNQGKMHACGHDTHMAMLMGTAMLLQKIRNEFGGTVLLVFQPGEEKNPGGARLMIESGAFENPRPDMFIAHHVLPELETGKVGYKPGRYMASCDEIYLTVEGKGGHAALPALTTDQIYIASNLIVKLKNTMAERQAARKIPTVLGIGKIIGEGATNVIPEKVEIAGTFRTFDERWRSEALDLVRLVADLTAKEYGVKVNVNISEGYPVLFNNEKLTNRAIDLSRDLLGSENVETYDIRMSSDDFSFYSSVAPSLYYRVGIKRKGTEMKKLHTPDFDIDEDGMETGVSNMTWLLYNFLHTS
ncbi:MAG TPA: M20 family metallopeptidase [Bacteroidales bacterium]|nr:M20 family metallopeptidase [Bacteroidales bacterium]